MLPPHRTVESLEGKFDNWHQRNHLPSRIIEKNKAKKKNSCVAQHSENWKSGLAGWDFFPLKFLGFMAKLKAKIHS